MNEKHVETSRKQAWVGLTLKFLLTITLTTRLCISGLNVVNWPDVKCNTAFCPCYNTDIGHLDSAPPVRLTP